MRRTSLVVVCVLLGGCTIEVPIPDLDLAPPGLSVDPAAPNGIAGILPPKEIAAEGPGSAEEPSGSSGEEPGSGPGADDPAEEPGAGQGAGASDPGDDPGETAGELPGGPATGGGGTGGADDSPNGSGGGPVCVSHADCWGGTCRTGTCHAPSCEDGVENQGETATDCGGPCGPCLPGDACADDTGCALGACVDGTCCPIGPCGDCAEECCVPQCEPGQCGDDGCGGSCGGCELGDWCSDAGTCERAWGCDQSVGAPCFASKASFGPTFRVTRMFLPPSGKKGQGFDLDPWNGVADCAPKSNCATGVDNAAAPLAVALNAGLEAALASKEWIWLSERSGDVLHFHFGVSAGGCGDGVCDYTSSRTSWTCTCEPTASFQLASPSLAISLGQPLVVPLRLAEGFDVLVPLAWARIEATTGQSFDSGVTAGLIGGAIRRTDLVDAISASGKPWLLTGLSLLGLEPDVDTDGDGVDDAISIGLQFEAEPAEIIGITWD